MTGKVTVTQLTEEERLAYIQRNPIKPMNKHIADYKWRGQKAAEASRKARDEKQCQI